MTAHPAARRTGGRDRTRPVLRLLLLLVALAGPLAFAPTAQAHPLATSAVVLDVGTQDVTAEIELPLQQLSVAFDRRYTAGIVTEPGPLASLRAYVRNHLAATDSTGRRWRTEVSGGRVETVDGTDHLVLDATLTPSSGAVGDFVLHYDAVIDRLQSHRAFATARYGASGSYTTLVMLSWQRTSVPVAAVAEGAGVSGASVASMAHLGIQHVAGGYDHLLFLTMLLLPVPLAVRRRQAAGTRGAVATAKRITLIATCFTLGHSVTLALVSFGVLHVPARPVETLVALSIAVAALHAIRRFVARGEALIAAGFGLVHGGAFATAILELNLNKAETVKAVLGFNLGIEAAQLAVIAAVVPLLFLASASHLYRYVVVAAASASIIAAADWTQATWRDTAPASDTVLAVFADRPFLTWTGLALTTLILWIRRERRTSGPVERVVPAG